MTLSSIAMLLFTILILQVFSVSRSDYSVSCVNDTNSETFFKPSADRVVGRYDVKWCTIGNVKATEWNLVLSYNLAKNEKNCNKRVKPSHKHSLFTQEFAPKDVNCTHMCFSTTLDMVFSGCFLLGNWLPALGSRQDLLAVYIRNNYTSESFKNNIINADAFTHDDYVAVHWHLGNVVASTYEMKLCSENTTTPGEEKKQYCQMINDNCTLVETNPHEIVCKLNSLSGSYYMTLEHSAPWTVGGVFIDQVFSHYSFEVAQGVVSAEVIADTWSGLWIACVAAVSCCVAAILLCVWRKRGDRALQRAVLAAWLKRKPVIEPVVPASTPQSVLLLYAREGELGEPLIRAITEYLTDAGMKVWDLYSTDTVTASAVAPASWLRSVLTRADTRVLLLQTPSLAALYGDRAISLDGADSALLHPRAVPAEPAPGDALLTLALRLLEEDITTDTPYNKYYLATLEHLETDTLPTVVPFRRYRLPRDLPPLTRDLYPPAQPLVLTPPLQHVPLSPSSARVQHACQAFVQHVQERPGYLVDHLRLLD